MNFATAVQTCFHKYASFGGRASRSEFWFFTLFFFLLSAAASIFDAMSGLGSSFMSTNLVVTLLCLLPLAAVTNRRLHDRDLSGWWQLAFIAIGMLAAGVAAVDIYTTFSVLISAGVAGGESLDAAQKALDQAEASPLGMFSLFGTLFWIAAALCIAATVVFYAVLAVRGVPGENRFGPDPLV
ncbi:MAG: DUF805 domain-containing protein [Proteobacteria bacterium]|nr:DUF805 domain-containing protein [Pseudomonadota bacterium]